MLRELLFDVKHQNLEKSNQCDFSNIVKGSKGYLKAVFKFDSDWKECIRIATFYGDQYESSVFVKDCQCAIPDNCLTGNKFGVKLTGINGDDYKITTNTVWCYQN